MNFMSMLRQKLNKLLTQAEETHGMKKTPLLLAAGVDPALFRQAIKGDRPFSNNMLRQLAESPYLDTSYEELLAWRAVDEYPPNALVIAAESVVAEGLITKYGLMHLIQALESQYGDLHAYCKKLEDELESKQ